MAWSSIDREELKKMRKQTENEKRIIERTGMPCRTRWRRDPGA